MPVVADKPKVVRERAGRELNAVSAVDAHKRLLKSVERAKPEVDDIKLGMMYKERHHLPNERMAVVVRKRRKLQKKENKKIERERRKVESSRNTSWFAK